MVHISIHNHAFHLCNVTDNAIYTCIVCRFSLLQQFDQSKKLDPFDRDALVDGGTPKKVGFYTRNNPHPGMTCFFYSRYNNMSITSAVLSLILYIIPVNKLLITYTSHSYLACIISMHSDACFFLRSYFEHIYTCTCTFCLVKMKPVL